ncbi:aminomethyl-transferring glycine dehydrogenase [Pontibacter akesuensis]|uniref:Glycine dehydrogenase (decarboxylating) n=1 Tax=Pontibacter akesuensis TaxID=388950 RepID=A0A1I7HQ60_9BACT|nr:aminomethyl-transferring glycine dehydrogenase [Pontibacter akesuensis]GHA62993.1 glycine dehydrogenase (aminomethyl-transferring) [Pontibacter akesuensis]SFU62801.1 glycine dehydrogenase (decarboxylating) alpha subunit [Pontibacter akesuensis]
MIFKTKPADVFKERHNGPDKEQMQDMLRTIGVDTLDQLIDETVPAAIRLKKPLNLPAALSEKDFLKQFGEIARKNKVYKSYIGLGYNDTIVPPVILRNIMENPGWYTAYTPYQAEIAQGRLEALINYQTMVMDLTGMEIANASLLDEGTAASEAMAMFYSQRKGSRKNATRFFVSEQVLPQTIDILLSRATPLNIELVIGDHRTADLQDETLFGALLQYPAADGSVFDYTDLIAKAHEQDMLVAVAADILSLTLLTPPGEMGADVVVGTTQRFGVPMGFGGPHAAFFATKDAFKRVIPGRIIGISVDAAGDKAYRMALQTREQHIRREKATSNICTAQVLLAVMSGMYAVYHGPRRLKYIGLNTHALAQQLENGLKALGFEQLNEQYFDTLNVAVESADMQQAIRTEAEAAGINFRYFNTTNIGISLNQNTELQDVKDILAVFAKVAGKSADVLSINELPEETEITWADSLIRKSDYLQQDVFNKHHSEHEMLRYMKHLENKDISLVHSMIPLGSCTMKLNATAEMIPVTWPEIGQLHPFAPADQTLGYKQIFADLEAWLCEVTRFDAVSLQPNSGAQGEYAGLMVIRAYHESRGDQHRNIALIPSSAHGTNPASAVMAGMKVVIVKCDEKGNIDVADLRAKAEQHKNELSCLMVTYPSTHGVYEESIIEICQIIHDNGGRVYMDGANMNAQVGLTSPAHIGADVCHLNLHKTFCIPHGGGGPGMGPIGVVKDLAPFLPGHAVVDLGRDEAINAISAAPWGSASILPISYAYIAMMGGEGLTEATKVAILNANYIKARLEKHYPVLYVGANGRCAHEMILDCRGFKKAGVEVEDIAKRLMDYGFHAPTVSFPVAGTLMVEPTESEAQEELDRFCDVMISIREEIREIEEGKADQKENVLKHAPHTLKVVMAENWERPYSREKAVFPMAYLRDNKVWPTVSRIDSAYGDRNLVCSCAPTEAYNENNNEMVAVG